MNRHVTLEICANGPASALAAAAGNADRIELCENLQAGGTTPSFGSIAVTPGLVRIPIHVLIRPRPGNFVYNPVETAVIKNDIEACKHLGINGVVFGVLTIDGEIDTEACKALIAHARPMSITFHRAFDECADPFEALEQLIGLGFDRILTSGKPGRAGEHAALLARLIHQAGDRIILMPGGGIRPDNARTLIESTGAGEIHSSCIAEAAGGASVTDPGLVRQLKDICNLQF
ncbi:MAG TPA: copper homeostasis protein CutC [Bacteroidales bacterium]|nr:copper homeostasis protein CutC [Bacteroidales bacterium]HSA44176.1 copper homeostasis protein CutC [Bacteroidales bacterium]